MYFLTSKQYNYCNGLITGISFEPDISNKNNFFLRLKFQDLSWKVKQSQLNGDHVWKPSFSIFL